MVKWFRQREGRKLSPSNDPPVSGDSPLLFLYLIRTLSSHKKAFFNGVQKQFPQVWENTHKGIKWEIG